MRKDMTSPMKTAGYRSKIQTWNLHSTKLTDKIPTTPLNSVLLPPVFAENSHGIAHVFTKT
jgi:hypothetical protein